MLRAELLEEEQPIELKLKTYEVIAIIVDGILFMKIFQRDEKKRQHIKQIINYEFIKLIHSSRDKQKA